MALKAIESTTKTPAASKRPVMTTSGTETRGNPGGLTVLNKTKAPMTKDAAPAIVKAPCVGALTSKTNRMKATIKNRFQTSLPAELPIHKWLTANKLRR